MPEWITQHLSKIVVAGIVAVVILVSIAGNWFPLLIGLAAFAGLAVLMYKMGLSR